MRRILSISMVVALAAALSACGSSSSDKGLSKADYVTKAEAICKAGATKVTDAGKTLTAKSTLKEVQSAYVDVVVPVFHKEISDLRALDAPKADRDQIKTMLDDLSDGVDQAETAIKAAKTPADLERVAEPAGLKKANAEAKAYGLQTCGSD